MFKMSDCTSTSRDKKWCSIKKMMQEFHSINDVEFGSELHTIATEFFYLKSKS
jgi:hypothetical protein